MIGFKTFSRSSRITECFIAALQLTKNGSIISKFHADTLRLRTKTVSSSGSACSGSLDARKRLYSGAGKLEVSTNGSVVLRPRNPVRRGNNGLRCSVAL